MVRNVFHLFHLKLHQEFKEKSSIENVMGKIEIETLVTTSFSHCPFCLAEGPMQFEWDHSIPKQMICSGCGAKWGLLFGLNEHWSFLGAKLSDIGSTGKGTNLKGRMYDKEFWQKMVFKGASEKPPLRKERVPIAAEKTVIIREIVKIRCPYCGGLYDEPKDRCPSCGGKR